MSGIYGGFEELIYESSALGPGATADPVGITTRLNPILDPSNINIRGTGRRGLYSILLGMRQPQFTMDILPTDVDWLREHQLGQKVIPYLHYKNTSYALKGLLFIDVTLNRVSVESRHNEAISATIVAWAEDVEPLMPVDTWSTLTAVEPFRWLDSTLKIPAEESAWWSWRYEINNNLQRLGNVDDGDTRDIVPRHRDVSGLIVKDLADFNDWPLLMAEASEFNITIEVKGDLGPGLGSDVTLLNQDYCRWGRIEAPVGPEDLQAKRFPFTAIDVT